MGIDNRISRRDFLRLLGAGTVYTHIRWNERNNGFI